MEQSSIFLMNLMSQWRDKIPEHQAFIIQQQLEGIDEQSLYALTTLSLKDPIIGLVLGIFFGLFGVDRFYKGDVGLGVVKLLLCWLTLGIWWAIDLYLVWHGIKNDNVQKIAQSLAFANRISSK
ncbi:TM2 domain-containing protein [Helicobacter sp. 23-1044]